MWVGIGIVCVVCNGVVVVSVYGVEWCWCGWYGRNGLVVVVSVGNIGVGRCFFWLREFFLILSMFDWVWFWLLFSWVYCWVGEEDWCVWLVKV